MSNRFDPARTLTPAGPLTLDSFVGAVWHASTALAHDPWIPGISGAVSVGEMWAAALLAAEPYCDGDRNGAAVAIANELFPGWRDKQHDLQDAARAQGHALLVWLERFDPGLN